MNKTKKFFALALALMMAFTTLVLPAAAAAPEDEGIMPLGRMAYCSKCGKWCNVLRREVTRLYTINDVDYCSKSIYDHFHEMRRFTDYYDCGDYDYSDGHEYCPIEPGSYV